MKINTQIYHAKFLGISQAYMNLIYTGKKPVSWQLAYKLSNLFPQKNIEWWKFATPAQIKTFLDYAIPSNDKLNNKTNRRAKK